MSKFKIKPFKVGENKRLEKINKSIPIPFPKLNQHLLMVAPTNSGKSTITANLLLGPLKFKYDRVVFFSPTYDYDIYKKIMQIDKENIHTEYSDETLNDIINENKKLEEEKGKPIFTLIIFDDFQELFYKGSYLENFLCKCRHWNITVWCLAQYSYAISKKSRQQFSNFICFPALSSEEDLINIEQVAPGSKKDFQKACRYVLDEIKQDGNVRNFLFINKSLSEKYWLNFEESIII